MSVGTPTSGRRQRALIRVAALTLAAIVACVACSALALDLTGNVHEVVAGQIYRSGQLSPARLAEVVAEHGIRSVLNLRGPNRGKTWYDGEIATCAALGIAHCDEAWSALHDISPERCAELAALAERLPKPLLIHCQGGSDRTGLASAIVLLDRGMSVDSARSQLSLRYLHFPYLGSGTVAMDRSFERYAQSYGAAHGQMGDHPRLGDAAQAVPR